MGRRFETETPGDRTGSAVTVDRSDELAVLARRVGVPMAAGICIATFVSALVGLLLVDAVGPLARADLDTVERLAVNRTASVDRLSWFGVFLVDVLTVAVLWVAATAIAFWRTGRLLVPAFLLFVIGGEKLTYLLTTVVVGRTRPPVEPLGHVFGTSSFPSGHGASAVTLYGAIAVAVLWSSAGDRRPHPSVAAIATTVTVVAVVLLVGFSRVYRGQHYPSDVVWGAVLGVGWLAAGCWLVLGRSHRIHGGIRCRVVRDRLGGCPRAPTSDERSGPPR